MANKKDGTNLASSMARLAEKLQAARGTRGGDIVFVATGDHAERYVVSCGSGSVNVRASASSAAHQPLVEIIGDAQALAAVLDGEKDAREQFFAGGLRVRGDLRYLSTMAMELGILTSPL